MATHNSDARRAHDSRLALRRDLDRTTPYGAWRPEKRRLSDQPRRLLGLWPVEEGRVARVLSSPPDRNDHPRSVAVGGRRVKTGSFPGDDTHALTLSLLDGTRRPITVVPPDTPTRQARESQDGGSALVGAAAGGGTRETDHRPARDDEGRHL